MDELAEDELTVIEQRCAAALAGPWEAFVGPGLGGEEFIRTGGLHDAAPDMYVSLSYRSNGRPKPAAPADLDFIAAARQDIPRLLDEVRRLRSLLG